MYAQTQPVDLPAAHFKFSFNQHSLNDRLNQVFILVVATLTNILPPGV